jgi:hypothetical protein
MSEKEPEVPTVRESKGDTNGEPWAIRTHRLGMVEVAFADGFGDGVRVSVTIHRHDKNATINTDEPAAMDAAVRMLRDIADQCDDVGAYLRGLVAESHKVATPGYAL